MKEIYIFHYHFITGGVTTVVSRLLDILKDNYKITIFASKEMGVEGIEDYLKFKNIRLEDFPEIGYIYPNDIDRKKYSLLKSKIFSKLKKHHKKNVIYWVHNHHLGKNPAFTSAFINFIKIKNAKTIFQIHDFPECARWMNFEFLKKCISHTLYPVNDNIIYITINKMDFTRLKNAGIPEDNIFYLPNAVSLENNFKNNDKSKHRKIVLNELQELIDIKEDDYIFLYPTRTIRRKNILEAVLLNRIFDKESNLIVTLGANSKKERRYEEVVKNVFEKNLVKGIWAISKYKPELFSDLMKGSDLIVGTSLLEGFGLLYLESKKYKQNFITREIDVLKDFTNITKNSFYDGIKVYNRNRKYLLTRYKEKINSLNIKKEYKNILRKNVTDKIDKSLIDFSYLDIESQREICLEKHIEDIRKLNSGINTKIKNLLSGYKKQGINLSQFSLKNYKKRVVSLIKKVENKNKLNYDNSRGNQIDRKVMESFLKAENIRLIFDY